MLIGRQIFQHFIIFATMFLINDKIVLDVRALKTLTTSWKERGEKLVFTNGCFDLLHVGHVQYLKQAKALGTKLMVALNSDTSVSALKGRHRPIQNEESRVNIMAALEFVDLVTIFNDDTPLKIIELIVPDVLVKGGDWKPENIVGSEVVIQNGGSVHSLHFMEGYSATAIEHKIISVNVSKFV